MAGFENPQLLGLLVLALPGVYLAFRHDERYRRLVSLSRSLLIAVLIIAAAGPFINAEQSVMKQPEITVLRDDSTSASVLEETEIEFDNIRVRERVIASGNSSDLRHGLLRNLEPNRAYLAVSDFQSSSNLEGVGQEFLQENSSLNALKVETDEEASVSVDGPSSTVPGANNRFTVEVHSTSNLPQPTVRLDGQQVELERTSNSTWQFSRTFSSRGSHSVTASIDVDDRFGQNNNYYHTVNVNKKPKILVLGEEGGIGERLKEFYRVDHADSLPEDLSEYYTIIMKKDPSREPVEYVSRGNGVLYTSDYENDMDILPVKKVPENQQNKGAKIVLAIDISVGTGENGGAAKKIKQIAYNLVERLPYNNRVGAVAYNSEATLISEPESLSKNQGQLKRKISRLKPTGPSYHDNGIRGAKELLNGTGNIIMITDGKIGAYNVDRSIERSSKRVASNLEVPLITVGAGEDRREDFLEELADRGNGRYLDAEDSYRLEFQFEAGGAAGETVPLVVVDPNHFVTEGLETSSSTSFFNSVEPRTGSDLLVTGTNGKPFLTTWRYGLGKVAAFSGGNSDLTQVARVDPLLVTRTVSWTVGDPKRKKDEWIEVGNYRQPEAVKARASYDTEGFRRQGENLYTATVEPGRLGLHTLNGEFYGYNYNPEIEEVGYSDKMRDVVRATGGEVYEPGEMDDIRNDLKTLSEKKVVKKQSLSAPLLVLALLLLLGEVGYRKMNGKK